MTCSCRVRENTHPEADRLWCTLGSLDRGKEGGSPKAPPSYVGGILATAHEPEGHQPPANDHPKSPRTHAGGKPNPSTHRFSCFSLAHPPKGCITKLRMTYTNLWIFSNYFGSSSDGGAEPSSGSIEARHINDPHNGARWSGHTQSYAVRPRRAPRGRDQATGARGGTRKEAMRCLKSYISRETYRAILLDACLAGLTNLGASRFVPPVRGLILRTLRW